MSNNFCCIKCYTLFQEERKITELKCKICGTHPMPRSGLMDIIMQGFYPFPPVCVNNHRMHIDEMMYYTRLDENDYEPYIDSMSIFGFDKFKKIYYSKTCHKYLQNEMLTDKK